MTKTRRGDLVGFFLANPIHFDCHGLRLKRPENMPLLTTISTDVAMHPDPLARAKELFQSGLQAHAAGELPQAEEHFRAALDLAPGRTSLLVNLGAVLLLGGKLDEALDTFAQVLSQEPDNSVAHLNIGICHSTRGAWQPALNSLRRAVHADPANDQARMLLGEAIEARYLQGTGFYLEQEVSSARVALEEVAAAAPNHYGAVALLGTLAHSEGKQEEAIEWLSRAAAINASDASVHRSLGSLLIDVGRLPEAMESLERSLALDPASPEAHYHRGWILQRQAQLDEALRSYDRALELSPAYIEALNDKSIALHDLGRNAEALACLDEAISIAPDFAEAHTNRGYLLNSSRDHRRLTEALASLDRALALNPKSADAWHNRGNSLMDLGRLDEALFCQDRAIELSPQHAKAHWNKGLTLLLMGRLDEGWPLYEWRWSPAFQDRPRSFTQPLWLGQESLKGKTILVHVEQGYGDTLQMCRFIQPLAERGARVVLQVLPPLRRLLSGLPGVDQVLVVGDRLPPFDFHCPFMSLPLALQVNWNSLGDGAAYLTCPESQRAIWSSRLGPQTRPRIGIAWSGNPAHKNDLNRSIRFEDLKAHLPRSIEWISLQKEVLNSDVGLIDSGMIRHFGENLHDFTDTAALCTLVDQVVAVDTSVAHLAGALGCKTTVLLPFIPDWRWLMNCDNSPWYGSVKLLRQGPDREWGPVLRRLADQLAKA